MTESFPRQQARTRRFSLGVPRAFTISPDGTRVVFLRTKSGADPVTCLWQLDVASGTERLVADPTALNAADEDLPPEEKAGGNGPASRPAASSRTPHAAALRWCSACPAGCSRPT